MRLPWPSRRSAGRSTSGATAPAAGDGMQQPVAPPVGRSEWREVGALRPSFRGDPGIRVQRFGDDLAGSQLPDPILGPLGHERSADGPVGLVTGLARTVVARVVAGPGGAQSLSLHRRRPPTTTDAPDTAVAHEPEAANLPSIEPRHVPVVATPMVARRLTVAPAPSGQSMVSESAQVPAARVPLTAQRTSAPLVGQTTSLAMSPGTAPVAASGRTAADAATPGTRTILRTASGSRVRLGPAISRAADGSAPDITAAAAAHVTSTGATPASVNASPASTTMYAPVGPLAGSATTWSAPVGLVLARVVATKEPSAAVDTRGSSSALGSAPLVSTTPLSPTGWPPAPPRNSSGVPADSAPASRSTASPRSRMTEQAPTLQRLAGGVPPVRLEGAPTATPRVGSASGSGRGSGSGTGSMPVPGSPVPGRPSRGMTAGGRVTIPAAAGPLHSGAGRAVLAHELVHVQQQRALGGAMPPVGSESAHRLESAARTAEAAVAWDELTLARQEPRIMSDSVTNDVTIARSAGAPMRAGAIGSVHAAIQLAEGDAPAPAPDPSSPTSSASAGAAVTGPGGMTGGLSDRDLDEVLRKLYPRLRRSLSSELLVARERAGVLADLR